MNKKILLWLIIVCLFASTILADVCQNTIAPDESCLMLTPSIDCITYNYTIFSSSGLTITNANLSLVNDSIYSLNFTEPEGGYIVKLCDGSTREIYVQRSDKMLITQLLILIAFWGAGIIFMVLMHVFAADKVSPIYGYVGGTIFIIFGSMTLFGLEVIDSTLVVLPFNINKIIGTLSFIVGLYCMWISVELWKFHHPKENNKELE